MSAIALLIKTYILESMYQYLSISASHYYMHISSGMHTYITVLLVNKKRPLHFSSQLLQLLSYFRGGGHKMSTTC